MDDFVFRPTIRKDIEETFAVRAATRQNPVSRDQLAAWGFTPQSVWDRFSGGEYLGWVCEHAGRIVGFCTGNAATGEIMVLAVLPDFEGLKIGKRLLSLVVDALREKGRSNLWLSASTDPGIRAHGFYRANGWIPTGRLVEDGCEELVLKPSPPGHAMP